ncbi:uncharacterized protein LOC125521334 isoform X1 [Triticum urartu]|uniref:uncharacterized protein LOC125521334 isoform X1 n=1 Tax=Triticum urartu TaxID=4572 RepID=UPI0020432ED0|nr:uncharacterized protein LOC125521334 isoform X1 [Triticum urartu]
MFVGRSTRCEIHHDATDEALLLCPSVIRQPCMRRPPSYTHLIVLMRLAVGWLLLGCSEDVLQIFRTLRAYLGLECCWVDEGHATWQVYMCPLGSCLSCSRQKPSLYMMDCTSIFLCVRLLHALLFPAGCCVDPWGFVFTSAISLPCKTQVFLVLFFYKNKKAGMS